MAPIVLLCQPHTDPSNVDSSPDASLASHPLKKQNSQNSIHINVSAHAKGTYKDAVAFAPAPTSGDFSQIPAASSLGVAVEWCTVGKLQQGHLQVQQWNQLASQAVAKHKPAVLVLTTGPFAFQSQQDLQALQEQLEANADIGCLVISPQHESGAVAAVALRLQHLQLFRDQLFPKGVDGADSLSFLYELYRRVGGSAMAEGVTLVSTNAADTASPSGIATGISSAVQPCRWLKQLRQWGDVLRKHHKRSRVVVDVCVPSYRVQYDALHKIVSCPWDSSRADVRFLVQIDNPRHKPEQLLQLGKLREAMQHRLVIRMNSVNLGRSGARNGCLEGSSAEYCVFFDDDVQPMQYCVNEYITAFLEHPEERCFAGPTFMPLVPRPMPMAVHMSGVIDFWEVPHWYGKVVPWAITANVAYKNSDVRFRFPRTGGGEDVDYCLQLGARTIAVPRAQAIHPWWPGNRNKYYKRMFRWFEGDGMLIKMWPELSYITAPSAIMCVFVLAVLACCRLLSVTSFLACSVAVWLSDFLAEIMRECFSHARRRYTPGPFWMRPQAAVESALLKSVSEFGRLYGHIKVGKYANVLRKFDWFCRYEPSFVATQQRFAAAKLAMFVTSGVAAHLMVGYVYRWLA